MSRTSFSVNVRTGAFHCFGCGAHGGDVLQFARLRYGLSFREAAAKLGALDESPTPETLRRLAAEAHEREQQRAAAELQRAQRRQRILALRDHLHTALRLEREAAAELEEIHQAGGNEEAGWHLLSLLLDYVCECDLAYCRAAGLESSE